MTSCRERGEHPFSALSFPSLFTWRESYKLTVAGDGEFFAVRSGQDGGVFCPCGDEDKCRAFLDSLDPGTKVLYLTREQAETLGARGWTVRHRPDLSEYVVSTAAEALRQGHISKSYRDKCRHFKTKYPYSARPVTPADLPTLRREFLGRWEGSTDRHVISQSVLRSALEEFEALGLQGVLLETWEGERVFLLGFAISPDMFTAAVTGHVPLLPPESTTVAVHELARLLDGKYEYMNLEEDLGIEGLRRAKELYSPVMRLEVYEAVKP